MYILAIELPTFEIENICQLQRGKSQDTFEVVFFLYLKKSHLTFCKQAFIFSRSETFDQLPV